MTAWGVLLPAGEPGGEIGDRLRIDLRLVPLQQHFEIAGPRRPGLPAPPAVALEIIRRRGERVGRAVDQVAPAVAVVIHRVFEIGGRQELGVPDSRRPQARRISGAVMSPRSTMRSASSNSPWNSSERRQS